MRAGDIRMAVVAAILACAPAVPTTHLYRVQLPGTSGIEPAPCEPDTRGSLWVRDMRVAGAYDDARMVYRESEYRLQRYEYHEWVVPPGELVSDALRDGYATSGWFARVEREHDASIDAELRGRVLAIEEVDLTRTRWAAHLRLELELLDARTHRRLWSHEYDLTRPLEERSPDGLAAATSAVLREVIDASAPALAAALSRPCARTGARTHSRRRETLGCHGSCPRMSIVDPFIAHRPRLDRLRASGEDGSYPVRCFSPFCDNANNRTTACGGEPTAAIP